MAYEPENSALPTGHLEGLHRTTEWMQFETEFRLFLLTLEDGDRIRIKYVDNAGNEDRLEFVCIVPFRYKVILYTYPKTWADVGMIQEDIDNGWDEAIHDVWVDITQTCEYTLFTE